jgi:hypothetical protein
MENVKAILFSIQRIAQHSVMCPESHPFDFHFDPGPTGGAGRPPTRKKPGTDWLYLQMVKQRDERGHFTGTKLKAIFGNLEEVIQLLGETTAYIERSNLTSRLFNGRQVRKTLAFSKEVDCYRAAATWEDLYYNFAKPHKSLRLRLYDVPGRKWKPRTPAMAAQLTKKINKLSW